MLFEAPSAHAASSAALDATQRRSSIILFLAMRASRSRSYAFRGSVGAGGFGGLFCWVCWSLIFARGSTVTGEATSRRFARDGDGAPRRAISDSRKSGGPAFSFSGVLRIARTFGRGLTNVSTACAHIAMYRS